MLATNPIDKEILDRAMAVIEQHLDDTEFNVNVFAREMAMARTNLFTKLKAITGQTPNDFILTIRLKKGALMLRNNPELTGSVSVLHAISPNASRTFTMSAHWPTAKERMEERKVRKTVKRHLNIVHQAIA